MNIQDLANSKGVELLAFYNGVALCDRKRGYHPFVSWQFGDDSFFWGHYSATREEADEEFKERIAAH